MLNLTGSVNSSDRAMIGITASATADGLMDRDNAARISNNAGAAHIAITTQKSSITPQKLAITTQGLSISPQK